jgi:hypothetical protein
VQVEDTRTMLIDLEMLAQGDYFVGAFRCGN